MQYLTYTALDSKFCDVKERMQNYFADTSGYNQQRISRADYERGLRNGEKGLYGQIFAKLKAHEQEVFNLNPYQPKMEALFGAMINNFKSMVVNPTDQKLQKTADQWSKVLLEVQKDLGFKDKSARIFRSGITSGFDLMFFNVIDDMDLSNRIVAKHIPYCNFYIDNSFTETNLSDCKYINTWGYLTETELRYCYQDYEKEVKEAICCGKEKVPTGKIGKYRVDEFWYLDYRTAIMVRDANSNRVYEWDNTQEELDYFLAQNILVEKVERILPTVRLALAIDHVIFYDEWNPMKLDRYPFAPFFCNFEPTYSDCNRSYGYIYNLMGAGYLGARAYTLYWKNLEKMINRLKVYKPTSLVNPEEMHDPNFERGIAIKKKGNIADVNFVAATDLTSSISNFISAMNQELQNTSGMNDAMLGSNEEDSGIKMFLRQGAGINIHANIFHNFDEYMKNSGEIIYELVRLHYDVDKIAILLNEEPTDEFYTKIFGKYGIEIAPWGDTTNYQTIKTKQLLDLSKAGVPIDPMDVLEACPLQGKAEIMENAAKRMEQAQKAQAAEAQMQQMQDEAFINLRKAETRSLDTNADHNLAKAEERYSKAEENITSSVKNISQAEKDQSQSYLNFAKSLSDVRDSFVTIQRLIAQIERQIGGIYGQQQEQQKQRVRNGRIEELLSGRAETAIGAEASQIEAPPSVGELL